MGKTETTEAVQTDAPTPAPNVQVTLEVQDITRSVVTREARGTIVATFRADTLITAEPEGLGISGTPLGLGVTLEAFPVKKNGRWMGKLRFFVQRSSDVFVTIPHEDLGDVKVLDPLYAEKVLELSYLAEYVAKGLNFDYGQRRLGFFASRKEEQAWMLDFGDHANPAFIDAGMRHPGLMKQVSSRLRRILAGDRGHISWTRILDRRNEELRDRLVVEIEHRLLEDKEAAACAVGRQMFEELQLTHLRDVPSSNRSMVSSVFGLGEAGYPDDGQLLQAMALRYGPAVDRHVVREGVAEGTIVVVTIDV